MKRFWLASAALLSVGVLGVSAAIADTWTDPAGETQGGAPDITGVAVTNDAAGTITMAVTVPIVESSTIIVFLDTDLNGRTTDPADRVFAAVGIEPGLTIRVFFMDSPVPMLDAKLDTTATTVTLSFAKTDAGIDKAFAFWVATQSASQFGTDQLGDEMPNEAALLTYVLTTPPPPAAPAQVVKPVIGAPATSPALPVAGKRFALTFPVTRSDNGAPLTIGTMVCDPSVKGKVIPHAESFRAGKARLSFRVPKTALGKLLKVKVTIRTGTQSATKVVSLRVR